MGLAELVDDQRDRAHEDHSDDQERLIEKKASHVELARRDEGDRKGKDRSDDPGDAGDPHPRIAKRHSISALHLRFFIPEANGCDEHQDIHHQVGLGAQRRQDPEGAAQRGHE